MTKELLEKSIEKKLQGFAPAQRAWLLAKCWKEHVYAEIDAAEQTVIDNHDFYFPEDFCGHKKGSKITSGFDACILARDNDSWDKYYALCYEEYKKRGIAEGYGESITYKVDMLYDKACMCLIDWMFAKVHANKDLEDRFPVTDSEWVRKNISYRDKFCEIAMKFPA